MTSIIGDLGPCIDDISSKYTVTRVSAATTFVKGRPVAPTTTTLEIRGVYQPMSGRERMLVPENIRDRELAKFYVSDSNLLETVDVVGKERADRIAIGSFNYVVHSEFDWVAMGGYKKYVLVKLNE